MTIPKPLCLEDVCDLSSNEKNSIRLACDWFMIEWMKCFTEDLEVGAGKTQDILYKAFYVIIKVEK